MDALNPRGIRIFWPLSDRKLYGPLEWDGIVERLLRAFLFIITSIETPPLVFSLLLLLAFLTFVL